MELPERSPSHLVHLDYLEWNVLEPLGNWTKKKSVPRSPDIEAVELYCGQCKKKFANEGTFQLHQKSAKHLKEAKRRSSISPNKTTSPKRSTESEEIKSKEVTEGLQWLRTAKEMSKKSPKKAIKMALNAGKVLAKHHRVTDSAGAFEVLLEALEQDRLEGSSEPDVVAVMLRVKAHSVLGRLYAPFDMGVAVGHFQEVVHCFVPKESVEEACKLLAFKGLKACCESLYVSPLLPFFKLYSSAQKSSASVVPAFLNSVNEAAGVISSSEPSNIAIFYYVLASVVAQKEGMVKEAALALRRASKLYCAMDLNWWGADCLVEACKLDQGTAESDLFEAMTHTLTLDDKLRCRIITREIEKLPQSPQCCRCKILAQIAQANEQSSSELIEHVALNHEPVLQQDSALESMWKQIRDRLLE